MPQRSQDESTPVIGNRFAFRRILDTVGTTFLASTRPTYRPSYAHDPSLKAMSSPLLSLRHLSVTADQDHTAKRSNADEHHAVLTVEALDIWPGERIAVVGASGSGKSTLLGIVAGTITSYSRPLRVSGKIQRVTECRVGMVMQDALASLNPLVRTLRQVQLVDKQHAVTWLERCGIDASLHRRYPLELSGGQRQRVAVAAALARKPNLIVADEPTSALDPLATLKVLDALDQGARHQQSALVMSTHNTEVAAHLCTRWLHVTEGRLEVFDVPPA